MLHILLYLSMLLLPALKKKTQQLLLMLSLVGGPGLFVSLTKIQLKVFCMLAFVDNLHEKNTALNSKHLANFMTS